MLSFSTRLIVGPGLTLICAVAMAQNVDRLSQVADTLARDSQFSGTVLVAKGDRVLLSRGYGDANVEWHVRNRPDTRFRLGSVTKQFTAAAVLLLQDQGKLKLTDAIGQYLPELPAAWHPVTVQQLLTHTSGIHSFTQVPEYANLAHFARTPAEILAVVQTLPLDFEPGSRFDYSNSNYVLLGMLIEKQSGKSYAEFIQKQIFVPLGMKDSGYDSNTAIVPNRAAGYHNTGRGLSNAGYIDMSVPYAAGALYSTSGDLLRWQRALYEGRLLSPEALRAMTTPVRNGYAFGLMVRDAPDGKEVGHGGNINGFSTLVGYRPNERISVILLSNIEATDLSSMERSLFQVTRGKTLRLPSERKAIPLALGRLLQVAGVYAMPDGTRFRVRLEDGRLSARLGGTSWTPIFAESDDHFFARSVDAQFEVLRSDKGTVDVLTLVQNGKRIRMERIADTAPEYATLPFYLRGDMNGWGTSDRMSMTDGHTFTATIKLDKRRYAFKLGSEDFKKIDIGAYEGKETVIEGAALPLEEDGQNLQIDIPESGAYRFTLDTTDARVPRLAVTRAAGDQ